MDSEVYNNEYQLIRRNFVKIVEKCKTLIGTSFADELFSQYLIEGDEVNISKDTYIKAALRRVKEDSTTFSSLMTVFKNIGLTELASSLESDLSKCKKQPTEETPGTFI